MNLRTLFLLLAAVLVLGFVAFQQLGREASDAQVQDVALFPGVDPARVVALRIEHAALDTHLRIERAPEGTWRITDPEDVPADIARVEFILKSALPRTGTPVPDGEADPVKLGLVPPRAVLEIEEDLGGTRRRVRLELGAIDPDQQRVNVRADGRLLRTWRDLDTTLTRPPEELRSHRLLSVDPREVVELHRQGLVARSDGGPLDIGLDALAEEGVWRATAPMQGALDPMGMSLVATGLARLTAKAYVDFGARPLAEWGLDPPEATLVLSTVQGETHTLRLGRQERRPTGSWHATVEGRPYVYGLDPADVDLLFVRIEDLLDHRIWRVARNTIEAVELEGAGRVTEIVRERGGWSVRGKRAGDADFGPSARAENAKVEDLLSRLDALELEGFDPADRLEAMDVVGGLHVRVAGGRFGGVLSVPISGDGGGRFVRFKRDGDEAVARGDVLLHSAATTPMESFASLMVRELVEVEQRALRVTDGNVTRAYTRGKKGQWVPEGGSGEARELAPLLDHLLFLRAERHLLTSERVELARSITVTFRDVNDHEHTAVVGLARGGELDGRAVLQVEGRLSVAREAPLHGLLAKLLAP